MANWLESAFGLGDAAEPIPAPRQKPIVQSFWVVTAQPTGAPGDLGSSEPCHYINDNGVLWLCDEAGKPLDDKEHILADGESERVIASRMFRAVRNARQNAGDRVPGFSRPLHYRDDFNIV